MRPRRSGVRLVLLAGFGGSLALMALAGLDAVRGARAIELTNAAITSEYLAQHHWLGRIRSALYQSSTLARDYLLENDPEVARSQQEQLGRLHRQMDVALADYAATSDPGESGLLGDLRRQVDTYWAALAPLQAHGAAGGRERAESFLRSQVLPRRALVISIADKIEQVHEKTLQSGNQRSAALFGEFRRRIGVMLVLTLGSGLLLAAASITYILRLEREARERYDQAVAAREELKSLSARLVGAQEQERRAIARELHDEVGQTLSALLVDLGNLSAVTPAGNEEAHHLLGAMKKLAETSVDALRNMALLLRPSMLDDLGLVPALEWQAREVSRRTGMRVQVAAQNVADELPEEHRTCIYRVVQEALHNSSRHASARAVRVSVEQTGEEMLLRIQDDGRGFDAARVRGLGLLGMEERVEHLGGSFEIASRPGEGTTIRIRLPLPDEARLQAVEAGA